MDDVEVPPKYFTSFEKYFEQFNHNEWFEIFYSKDEACQKCIEILNELNPILNSGYLFLAKFYRDSMKDEIKSDYYFDKCKEYLQKKQS